MFSHVDGPRPGGDGIPYIRRLKKNQRVDCKIGAVEPTWIFTHFSGQRGTTACEAKRDRAGTVLELNGCEGCKEKEAERRRGYLWIYNTVVNRLEFLELTPTVWFAIEVQANGRSDLRGWELAATRGNSDQARVSLTLHQPRASDKIEKYRAAPSPDASIKKLMRK